MPSPSEAELSTPPTKGPIGRAKSKPFLTGEELRKRSKELDLVLVHRAEVPEKVLIQSELGYMRRQLLADRRSVSITYPVNPPYAFVHIGFDEEKGEFEYDALEPTLHAGEKDLIA